MHGCILPRRLGDEAKLMCHGFLWMSIDYIKLLVAAQEPTNHFSSIRSPVWEHKTSNPTSSKKEAVHWICTHEHTRSLEGHMHLFECSKQNKWSACSFLSTFQPLKCRMWRRHSVIPQHRHRPSSISYRHAFHTAWCELPCRWRGSPGP